MSDEFINDRADWLVDAVATATQNRMFLRGEPECDDVATDAIYMNGQKALQQVYDRQADRIEELEAEAGILRTEKHADAECIGGLEAKLATALEALREIASGPDHNTDAKIARAALAELKGGDA